MKLTITPRQLRRNPVSYVEVKSDNMSVILPDMLSTEALSFLEECETRLEVAMGQLQSVNSNIKRDYIRGIKETYDTLISAIHSAQIANKSMLCRISGIYNHMHNMPCIENWAHCNPGRMAAINYIIRELRANGWQPEPLKLSPFLVGAEDHLCSGGTDIVLKCDFTEVID